MSDEETKLEEMTEEQRAEARGDVFAPEDTGGEIPLEGDMNPEILARIAGEETGETGKEKVGEDDSGKKDEDAVKKDDFIPKARFNELNEENKQLKARLEALERGVVVQTEGQEVQAEPDLKAQLKELRTQQKEALLEGDHEEHDRLTEEIDAMQIKIAKAELQQETSEVEIKTALSKVTEESISLYPFLDSESEQRDVAAIVAVRTVRFQLEAEGVPPAEALRRAVEENGPKFAKVLGFDVDTKKAEEVRAAREKTAKERAADASIRQPARLPDKAEKSTFSINVNELTPAQINAMSEDQKARMRGDII